MAFTLPLVACASDHGQAVITGEVVGWMENAPFCKGVSGEFNLMVGKRNVAYEVSLKELSKLRPYLLKRVKIVINHKTAGLLLPCNIGTIESIEEI